jgi:hypothetical protein
VAASMPATVEEILLPASSALDKENRIFCRQLERSIWNYFKDRFPDSDINMSKSDLAAILNRKAVKPELVNKLTAIIHQCETGVYANAEINVNKSELIEKAIAILNSIDKDL